MKIHFSKRQKFVFVSFISTLFLLLIQLAPIKFRYHLIFLFSVSSYFLSVWPIKEDIKKIEWLTLFILPTLFSLGVSLFYFLLPVRWLTRLPFSLLFGISFYAILLSENIFNIAAIRTIQLHQAALAVSSFLSILTFFLFSNIIFSFKLSFIFNFLIFLIISFTLFLKNFWDISLEQFIESRTGRFSFYLSILVAETALILSFWPIIPLINSLFLTTIFYLLLGITETYLSGKPLGNLIWEYTLFIFTLLILVFNGRWGG